MPDCPETGLTAKPLSLSNALFPLWPGQLAGHGRHELAEQLAVVHGVDEEHGFGALVRSLELGMGQEPCGRGVGLTSSLSS